MENFSIKWETDISDLKASVEEIKNSLKKVDNSCSTAQKGLDKLEKASKSSNEALKKYADSIGSVDNRLSGFGKKAKSLEKQIIDLTVSYRRMSDEEKKSDFGKQLALKIEKLKQEAGDLNDVMADVRQEIKHLSSDTSFADSMNAWTGVIGNCSSAMVALTGDSKKFEEVIRSLAKIQTLTSAVKSLTEAFQAQNLVLLKNPLVIAGAAIVGTIVAISNAFSETTPISRWASEFEKMGEYLDKVNEKFNEFLELAKSAGATPLKIAEMDLANADSQIEENNKNWETAIKLAKKYREEALKHKSWSEAAIDANKEANYWEDAAKMYKNYGKTLEENRNKKRKNVFDAKVKEEANKKPTDGNAVLSFSPDLDFNPNWDETSKKAYKDFQEFINRKQEADTVKFPVKFEPLTLFDDEKGAQDFWLDKAHLENLQQIQSTALGISSAFQAAASSLGQFAQQSEAAAAASKAFTIAGAIAQLVAQFAAIPKGKEIWSWIAGTVAGVGTLVATIASLKNATNSFAEGGIIGGSSSVGDRTLIFANKGEMILNNQEQARLFNALKWGNGFSSSNSDNSMKKVEFKVKGQDLVGVLRNHNSKMSKI